MSLEKASEFSRIVLFALLVVFVFSLFSGEISSPDFWWHLKTGEYIYQTRSLPVTDPFSFTSVVKDRTQESLIKFIMTQYWLAQVIFYWIYLLFGFPGIIYMRASILTLLLFLLFRGVRREGVGFYYAIALVIPAVIVFYYGFFAERPQLFSFLLCFLLVYLLEGFRRTATDSSLVSKSLNVSQFPPLFFLIPLPFIMILWANLHGGFILGILTILAYLFSEGVKYSTNRFGNALAARQFRLLAIFGTISIAASFLNPNGFGAISVVLEREQGLYNMMVTETVSPFRQISLGFYSPEIITFFGLLFAGVILFLVNIRRLDLTDVTIFSGFAAMGLYYARVNPFFTPIATLLISRYGMKTVYSSNLSEKLRTLKERCAQFVRIPFAGIILPLALSSITVYGLQQGNLLNRNRDVTVNKYPEGAARFLKEHKLSGNMFNPYDWGGYLLWALYPEYKVFIDGRGLNEKAAFDGLKIMEAYPGRPGDLPEWRNLLAAYKINFIATYSVNTFSGQLLPLIYSLLNDTEWNLVYMDNISLIFARDAPANRDVIERFGIPKEWIWNEVLVEATLKSGGFWSRNVQSNFFTTIGDAFFARQNYREARTAYLRALALDRSNQAANNKLAVLRYYGY